MSIHSNWLNTSWRRVVLTLSLGATGAAISAVATWDGVFAKQFALQRHRSKTSRDDV